MACGLPVIATDWSAQCDFFSDDVGYPIKVERLVPDLVAEDFIRLPRFRIYIRLSINGAMSEPLSDFRMSPSPTSSRQASTMKSANRALARLILSCQL